MADSVLFITPEKARVLDCAWVWAWFRTGGGIKVQAMPPDYPALFVEKRPWPSHS